MNGEEYAFYKDISEKKMIARSSHNMRPHCGRSGKVRFPSDNLSKKELNAMNGELKTYKLNSQMTFSEFEKMPDDLKVAYIKNIQEKFNAPLFQIGKMLGISKDKMHRETKRLGIDGKGNGGLKYAKNFDKEAFCLWAGLSNDVDEENELTEKEKAIYDTDRKNSSSECGTCDSNNKEKSIPISGRMRFYGGVKDIMETVLSILGNGRYSIDVEWYEQSEERGC